MLGRLSLKARLVLGVIVLSAIGLAAADVATYASLRSFLVQRTDESLQNLSRTAGHDLERGCMGPGDRPPLGASPGDFFQIRQGAQVLCTRQVAALGETTTPSPPRLPSRSTRPPPSRPPPRATAGATGSTPSRRSAATRSSSPPRSTTSTRRCAGCS